MIKKKFFDYGWEGDGHIGLIWLPPFVDVGQEGTYGTYIWHVKQNNNGISYLACDEPLNFKRLQNQNENRDIFKKQIITNISIIEECVKWFNNSLIQVENDLDESIKFLNDNNTSSISLKIKSNLLIHSQGILVRYFQEFMDDCYLQLLIDAIEGGNPNKIKLKKSHVKLDPFRYLPETNNDEESELFDSATDSLTIRGVIRDIWNAYKWEPFDNKKDMLFKCIDYKPDQTQLFEIRKHIILRNCMQHHEGSLDRNSLDRLGLNEIIMKGDSCDVYLKPWNSISFSQNEILHLLNIFRIFVSNFHDYVKIRVPTVFYKYTFD